jgi:hypothetical protein
VQVRVHALPVLECLPRLHRIFAVLVSEN